jgi:methylenetetrahydrofolate reductase (NADPH)
MTATENMPGKAFFMAVEVVPPTGPDPAPLLASLSSMDALPVDAFSVATNPVAKARMSAMALCTLIQQRTGRAAILHCTTRDHNRLSLQGLLWGARALGIATVLVTTGDFVALQDRATTSDVRDIHLFSLLTMAREAGLRAGVVLDPGPTSETLARAVDRLARKADAGAQFVVTQPIYEAPLADALAEATLRIALPLIMGILPLRTPRHADFLHNRVVGITVPRPLRERMHRARDPIAEGIAIARENLALARERFAGACIMPPFDHYEILPAIL